MAAQHSVASEGKTKIKAAVPSIILNLLITALIWAFGALIFIPLSANFVVLETISIHRIVALIFLIAIAVSFIRVFAHAKNLADGLADVIAAGMRSKKDADQSHIDQYRGALRLLFYVIGAVIGYMFLYPFLAPIAAPIAGIVFIVLAIWSISTLFRVGSTLTEIVYFWADIANRRIDRATDAIVEGTSDPASDD